MDPAQAAKGLIDFHPVWGSICVLLLIAIGVLWKSNQNLHAEGKKELREILEIISKFNAASSANLAGLEQSKATNEGVRRAMEEQAKATEILATRFEFQAKATESLGTKLDRLLEKFGGRGASSNREPGL